ncbi:nucleotidyltransferase domain-containing protein [Candidatus Woesearchaeota archaeon]|nr:nucleotidyltransferase domain-containing protein [Candidatus Woesearchaeota archaeon]
MVSPLNFIEEEIKRQVSPHNLKAIILFGSAVKSLKKANDYDLLILTAKKMAEDWKIAGKIKTELMPKLDKPVDIVFMEEDDLNYASPFLYEIGKKHRLIYGKDYSLQFKEQAGKVQVLTKGGVNIGWKIAQ